MDGVTRGPLDMICPGAVTQSMRSTALRAQFLEGGASKGGVEPQQPQAATQPDTAAQNLEF